jgi:hypothetical protein
MELRGPESVVSGPLRPMGSQHGADGRPRLPSAEFRSPGEERSSSPGSIDVELLTAVEAAGDLVRLPL